MPQLNIAAASHPSPVSVLWTSDLLLSGISPRDLVDEYYIRTFSKCRDVYCHTMERDKIDIPIYDYFCHQKGADVLSHQTAETLDINDFRRPKMRDRLMSRSIQELPPLSSIKDVTQVLTCTDAVFSLKMAIISEQLNAELCESFKMSHGDFFAFTNRILPVPYVDSLPEHVFIQIWGADLMTPLAVSRIVNSLRDSECQTLPQGHADFTSDPIRKYIHDLSPMLVWRVYENHQLAYKLHLCRFHHYLLSLLGENMMCRFFGVTQCRFNFATENQLPTKKRITEASQDETWQKRRSIGEIRAVLADLVETVEFASNVTDKSIDICLMEKYLIFKTPPVSPRLDDFNPSANGSVLTMCSCAETRRLQLDALAQVIPICSTLVLRHNLNISDWIICISIVISHGLLCGDNKARFMCIPFFHACIY